MQNYLDDFHTTKDVFLRFRGGKRGKAMAEKAEARVLADLNKAYDAEKLGQAAYETTYKSSLNFAFVKLHLMSHFGESIKAFGNIKRLANVTGTGRVTGQVKNES